MHIQREKSLLQKSALWTLLATLSLAFLIVELTEIEIKEGIFLNILTGVLLASLLVHGFGMLRNAIKLKRYGWLVLLILFGPFASIPYYFFVYNTNSPHKGTNTTPPLPNSWH